MTRPLSDTVFLRISHWPAFLPKSPQLSWIAVLYLHRSLIAFESLDFPANADRIRLIFLATADRIRLISLLPQIELNIGLACVFDKRFGAPVV